MVCGRPLCRQGLDRRHSALVCLSPALLPNDAGDFTSRSGAGRGRLAPKFFYCAAQQQALERAAESYRAKFLKIFIRLDFPPDFGYSPHRHSRAVGPVEGGRGGPGLRWSNGAGAVAPMRVAGLSDNDYTREQ